MLGGLEGLIFFVPLIYLGLYILAYIFTRRHFP